MVDTTGAASPQEGGQLMKLGAVAAENIAAVTGLKEHTATIEKAIADEINAMSTHFTLAFADVSTQYEVEVLNLKKKYEADLALVKSEWTFIKANPVRVGVAALVALLLGALIGHFA